LNTSTKLENWPIYISLFSVGFLTISVIYDFGYFTYLGLSFAEAPTSISDHIRSSLVWLPTLVFSILAIFIYESAMKRVEGGMTEDELINTSPAPRFTKWFRASPYYFMTITALSVPILWFYGIKPSLNAIQFSLIIIWFLFHNWIYNHLNIMKNTSTNIYLIGRWLPAIAILISFLGAITAQNTIKYQKDLYKIQLPSSTIEVILLRTFDSYFLVWDSNKGNYEFISKSLINNFEPITKPKTEKKSNNSIQPPKSGTAGK